MKERYFSSMAGSLISCLFLFISFPSSSLAQPTHTGDSLELVNFFNSTGGPNWNSPWNLNSPVSTWNGIDLTGQTPRRVREIWLSYDGLAGTLPNLNLPELESLQLYGNDLIGALPGLDSCVKLEEIEVNSNDFAGTLPDFNLPLLRDLDASDNNLAGPLPGLDSLVNLRRLELYQNDFSGAVPDFQLPSIETLFLDDNDLTSIPNFTGMPALESLSVSYNYQLGGQIPDFNLPALTSFYAESCRFDGPLPGFTNCPNLVNIGVNGNYDLDGAIPNYSITHPNMNWLDLGSCRFISCPPLTGFTNLSRLYLSGNRLTFDDLLPQIGLASNTYSYSFQDWVEPIEDYFNLLDGDSVELYYPADDSISTNIYEWRKDGVPFDTTSTNRIWLYNMTSADDGQYTCAVTNPALPGLSIQLYPIYITVAPPPPPADPADSAALVMLYNATGGANWTSSWTLTNMVHSWSGVTLNTSGQVSGLSLANRGLVGPLPVLDLPHLITLNLQNNSLTGAIPAFTNCPDLKFVYLGNNQFNSCPDQSGAANLTVFSVFGNQLSFEDLLPNAGISNFTYSPQANTMSSDLMAAAGANLELHFPIDSMIADNHYVWYRNGQTIDSLNANSLVLSNLTLADSGIYHCLATNPALPELILALDSFHVNVSLPDKLEAIEATEIRLAPNPASDVLTLMLDETLNTPAEGWTVQLVDLQGRVVRVSRHLTNSIQLEVRQLSAGIYVAKLSGDGKFWSQTWMKAN